MKKIIFTLIIGFFSLSHAQNLSGYECVELSRLIEKYSMMEVTNISWGMNSSSEYPNIILPDNPTEQDIVEYERLQAEIKRAEEEERLERERLEKQYQQELVEIEQRNAEQKRKRDAVIAVYEENNCDEHFANIKALINAKL